MANTRKATITVDWKLYGLSASLDVETSTAPSLLSMTCNDIDSHGGWWFTVDHGRLSNPTDISYSYPLTFSDDIGSTQQEIIDLINSGEMTLTSSVVNDSGGVYPIEAMIQCFDNVIYITVDDNKTGNYYQLWNTRVATVTLTLSYPKYDISTTYSFKVPPFGLLINGPSDEVFFTLPDISISTYYRAVNDPIQLTINSAVSSYQQYFQEWIDNDILKATGFLNHLMDSITSHNNLYIQTTYGTEWNKYLNDHGSYSSFDIDYDICNTWIDQNDFKKSFATTLQIIPVKSAYGDCELVPYLYFNGQNIFNGHINENGYMIYNEDDYSHSVANMVSSAAASRLSYAPGTIYNDQSGGDWNIGEMGVKILSSPTLCSALSSGMTFNIGNTSGSDVYYNVCFLMLGFSSATEAQDFMNMTQAGLIYMTMTTNGTGSNIIKSSAPINDLPNNLHIPTTQRDRLSPCCFYGSGSSSIHYIKEGPVNYGNYYYVILFYNQYNEPANVSNISQGVRLRFYNALTGSYTQGSNPSYIYFNGNNAQYLYNIIGWEL